MTYYLFKNYMNKYETYCSLIYRIVRNLYESIYFLYIPHIIITFFILNNHKIALDTKDITINKIIYNKIKQKLCSQTCSKF